MAESPSPGQVAYEAWFHWRYAGDPLRLRQFPPFADLQTITQRAWDAAAQAVLTDYLESVARLCRQELAQQQAVLHAQETRAGFILSRAELEHLLNCLANQKFLHEMAEPLRDEAQALIDMAWRQGMDWLAQGPQRETSAPTCRWCGQAQAAHPQAGEPWRCRLSDGPLLPKEPPHA